MITTNREYFCRSSECTPEDQHAISPGANSVVLTAAASQELVPDNESSW